MRALGDPALIGYTRPFSNSGKTMRRFYPILPLTMLAACALVPQALRPAPPPPARADFHGQLAAEYRNLAAFARKELKDDAQAGRFAAKAEGAEAGRLVPPENPAVHELPQADRAALAQAHAVLADALAYMKAPENAPLLALAQTHYDCWILTEEEYRGPAGTAAFPCRGDFEQAIAQLSLPQNGQYRFDIDFPRGLASVEGAAAAEIGQAARRFGNRALWTILLSSYDGEKGASENLSMRRAIAVKNALAQQGIGQERVLIQVVPAPETRPGAAGSVEISFLPDYIGEGRELHSRPAPGWDHSGSDF
jgi:outer membrane protein OmpA-like peptidoglycan-associated protein